MSYDVEAATPQAPDERVAAFIALSEAEQKDRTARFRLSVAEREADEAARALADAREAAANVLGIDAAPYPVEVAEAALVETVARAIAQSDAIDAAGLAAPDLWDDLSRAVRREYRRLAAAAIAAYRAAQDGGAEEAVRRVEALADHWDTDADARYSSARIAKSTAARALRVALDQNGGQER